MKNGDVVTLLAGHTFPALTDDGFRSITWPVGTTAQITGTQGVTGVCLTRGAFSTWYATSKLREATSDEAFDFDIGGSAPEPKAKKREA